MQYVAVAAVTFATSYLMRKYFPVKLSQNTGLSDLSLPTIAEGTRLPMIIGTRRTSGNYIWIGDYKKHSHKQSVGKGGNSSSNNNYHVSFAIALCSVNMSVGAHVVRIWHNDEELTGWADNENIRLYSGVAGQQLDSYLSSQTGRWSNYEGICYAVFEDYDLGTSPGLPALSFEVHAGVIDGSGSSTLDTRSIPNELTTLQTDVNSAPLQYLYNDLTTGNIYSLKNTDNMYQLDSEIDSSLIFDTSSVFSNNIIYTRNNQPDGSIRFTCQVNVGGIKVDSSEFVIQTTDAGTDAYRVSIAGTILAMPLSGYGSGYIRLKYNSFVSYKDEIGATHMVMDLDVCSMRYINGILIETDSVKVIHGVGGQFIGCWDLSCVYVMTDHYFAKYVGNEYYHTVDGQFTPLKYNFLTGYSTLYPYQEVLKGGITEIYLWLFEAELGVMSWNTYDSNLYFDFPLNIALPSTTVTSNQIPLSLANIGEDGFASALERCLVTKSTNITDYDYLVPDIICSVLSNQKSGALFSYKHRSNDINLEVEFNEYANTAASRSLPVKISLLADDNTTFLDMADELFSYEPGYFFIKYDDFNSTSYIGIKPLDDNRSDGTFYHPVNGYQPPEEFYLSDILTGDDISITRKSVDSTKNQIRLNFSNREKKYDRAVSNIENELSERETGKREAQASMLHCCKSDIAACLADQYLQRNLQCPFELKFETSIKYIEKFVIGAVVVIMDDVMDVAYTVRVTNTVLSADYTMTVTAQQILSWHAAYVAPKPQLAEEFNITRTSQRIKTAYIFELPAFVTGGKTGYVVALQPYPEDVAYGGAVVYESTDGGNSYNRIDTTESVIIGGYVISIGAGKMTIYTETDDTLPSYPDADSLLNGGCGNLIFVPSLKVFLRYGQAQQVGIKTWQLDWVIYDAFGCPAFGSIGDITVGTQVAFLDVSGSPYFLEKQAVFAGRSYSYKFPTYNLVGSLQDISFCTSYSDIFGADGARPLPVSGIAVNGYGSADVVSAGDLTVTWLTRNKLAILTLYEDTDFVGFRIEIAGHMYMTTDRNYVYTHDQWISDGSPSDLTIKITKVCATMESLTTEKMIKVVA